MRCYDPAGRIVYVHPTGQAPPCGASQGTTSPMDARTPDRLPAGYANHSPRTRMRRDARERSDIHVVTAEGAAEGVACERAMGVSP